MHKITSVSAHKRAQWKFLKTTRSVRKKMEQTSTSCTSLFALIPHEKNWNTEITSRTDGDWLEEKSTALWQTGWIQWDMGKEKLTIQLRSCRHQSVEKLRYRHQRRAYKEKQWRINPLFERRMLWRRIPFRYQTQIWIQYYAEIIQHWTRSSF